MHAALKRPLFVARGQERVDYDHRTSAEFLGAAWIADAVRKGLPIARVTALICVDGHPASELRGLHAWLPVFLPEHAERFIRADPLGVLEYGDASSLPLGSRRALLDAIGKLAAENPWFLSFQRHPGGLGALVQDDSVDDLCTILADRNAPRDLRMVALEAFAAAPPKPAAFAALRDVFVDASRNWFERSIALKALLAFGDPGEDAVVAALPSLAGNAEDALRLRGQAIEWLYGRGLGQEAVVALMGDLIATELESSVGLLWSLADSLPVADIPPILDQFLSVVPSRVLADYRRSAWGASSFVSKLVVRVGKEAADAITPTRVIAWMELRQRLKRLGADDRDQEFLHTLGAAPDAMPAAFDLFVDRFQTDEDERPGQPFRSFVEVIGSLANADDICEWCLARLARETDLPRRS